MFVYAGKAVNWVLALFDRPDKFCLQYMNFIEIKKKTKKYAKLPTTRFK